MLQPVYNAIVFNSTYKIFKMVVVLLGKKEKKKCNNVLPRYCIVLAMKLNTSYYFK